MTPTHEQVLAAIDKARLPGPRHSVFNAHCDDLRATAERHHARLDAFERENCCVCVERWPCPDYRQVIDRLTAWGVL